MPIDQMMLGPMLDTFKNMAADCKTKGCSGESFDKMITALNRMETLGQEMDDFMAYTTKLTTEGLQMDFSLAYGQVLAEEAQGAQENATADGYDDNALLKQTLDALRNAVAELKKGETAAIAESHSHTKDKNEQAIASNEISTLAKTSQLVKPIEDLITFGESGINFPTFLRVQIEKGLDKAMEGSAVLREGIAYELDHAMAASLNPYHIAIKNKQVEVFDQLAAQTIFKIPNSLTVSLAFNQIEADYISKISTWTAIETAWERIFNLLDTWVIAQTRFAPQIEPWAMAPNPSLAILKDKETLPGMIDQRIRIFAENYQLNFAEIFLNETFRWRVKHHHFKFSQIYTDFLIKRALPKCKPGQLLDNTHIQDVEKMYENFEMPNPENYKVLDRQEVVYDNYFGAGGFVLKFGIKPNFGIRNATAWKFD